MICIASIPAIRRKVGVAASAFRLPGGYAIPVAGFAICLWLVAQSQLDDWIRVSVLLGIGAALYGAEKWYYGRRRSE
jgi:hypothetical protein